jgi:hypothetical protein
MPFLGVFDALDYGGTLLFQPCGSSSHGWDAVPLRRRVAGASRRDPARTAQRMITIGAREDRPGRRKVGGDSTEADDDQ